MSKEWSDLEMNYQSSGWLNEMSVVFLESHLMKSFYEDCKEPGLQ